MDKRRIGDGFLNLGHGVDHLMMLIYPTVILAMSADMVGSYGAALTLALGGFIAFGACSIPAGWLGDHWSRHGMMVVFFVGIGVAAILTGFARNPFEIAAGLTLVGVFAAIYHPVGIAMLVSRRENVGRVLGINGVAGNLGVALASLVAAALADLIHWRAAFMVPGALSIAAGIGFALLVPKAAPAPRSATAGAEGIPRDTVRRIFCVLVAVTVFGGLVFNSTTIAMPKVFDERLSALTQTTMGIGALVSGVYVIAAMAQLCVGYLIDRHPIKGLLVVIAACQAPLLFIAGIAEGYAMLAVAVAMMFVVFGQIPINDAMVARFTDESWRSRVYAVRYVMSFGAAAVSVPLVAQLHGTFGGFQQVFIVLAVFASGTLAASLAFPALRPAAAV